MSQECAPPRGNKHSERKSNLWDWLTRAIELALLGGLVVLGDLQYRTYNKQAGLMQTQNAIGGIQAVIANRQAEIMDRQNDIAAIGQRAFVSATNIHFSKKRLDIPGTPGPAAEFTWWFSPTIENSGNTPTKNLRISPGAAIDPSRPGVSATLPLTAGLGQKQSFWVAHFPDAGPPDPEQTLIEAEALERQGKPSKLIRMFLGPHTSQTVGGFGITQDEITRRMHDGGKWFVLGAIHYEDSLSSRTARVSKYCFVIGFDTSETGDIEPAIGPCPHWNCADDECDSDKSAYEAESKGWVNTTVFTIPPPPPPSTDQK
jgi:hypothetical protein